MLRSMTAYGRALVTDKLGRFVVEIQSLNRKFLEINLNLSPELQRFESEIRREISSRVGRGQLNVKASVIFEGIAPIAVIPNLPLAKELKHAWDTIANELNMPTNSFKLDYLLDRKEVLTFQDNLVNPEECSTVLLKAVKEALEQLFHMKDAEAANLKKDIESRLSYLKKEILSIEERSAEAPKKYRQKLAENIQEVMKASSAKVELENEERILREICLFSDKVDISEEITRFKAHIERFEYYIHSPDPSIGKTLEFLLQEFVREINTISSKSQDTQIAHWVVGIKTEIERIREQIQNVE